MANTTVFIDTFIDCDIGYYPRIGLLDRRFNPRPASIGIQLSSGAKRRAFEQFNWAKQLSECKKLGR